MTADELWERYSELSLEQALDLESFCRMAASGELGQAAKPGAIVEFLRRVESLMLANIEVKLQEAPYYHAMRDEAVERTRAMIASLMERYGDPPRPEG